MMDALSYYLISKQPLSIILPNLYINQLFSGLRTYKGHAVTDLALSFKVIFPTPLSKKTLSYLLLFYVDHQ